MPCLRRTWPLLLVLAPALSAQAAAPSDAIDAPALFAANCAQCHGLDGSGAGPTVLDRPARNFKEGGFSFGNTPETIARTIAYGIPGSPMPAFELGLSEAQRLALAEYVVTLGPPVQDVTEAETLLHVTDRPLIVRGILPPLAEGGPVIPRGLLIGTPDGLTFQYAADDVRLLAVRQGDFVKRTDWGGRGGTPLEPLGKAVWTATHEGIGRWFDVRKWTAAPTTKVTGPGELLACRLLSTNTEPAAVLNYAIVTPDPAGAPTRVQATVTETVSATTLGSLAGYSRRFAVRPNVVGSALALRVDLARPQAYVLQPPGMVGTSATSADRDGWWGRATEEGPGLVIHASVVSGGCSVRAENEGLTVLLDLRAIDEPVEFRIETFLADPAAPDILALLPRASR